MGDANENDKSALDNAKTVFDGDAGGEDRVTAGRDLIQAGLDKAENLPGVGKVVKTGNKINKALDKADEVTAELTANPATGENGRTLRERAGDQMIGITGGQTDQEKMDAKQKMLEINGDPRTTMGAVRAFGNTVMQLPGQMVGALPGAAGEAAANGVLKAQKFLNGGDDGVARNDFKGKPGDGEQREPNADEKVIYVGNQRRVVPKTQVGAGS